MDKNKDFDKQMEICKKLGAVQFKKIVFIVEKIKFKALKKLVPNYLKYFDKHVDKLTKKRLKDAKTEEEKQIIIYKSKIDKMQERREFYQEENRNYHIRKENPTQIIKYLELNKKIHKNGLVGNAIFGLLTIPGLIFGSKLALMFLVFEIIEAIINFECINLQNYNIYRLTKVKDKIEKKEKAKIERDSVLYKEISEDIHKVVMEKDEIPTIDDVLACADTPEKLEQLKQLLAKTKSQRNIPETHDENGFQKTIK